MSDIVNPFIAGNPVTGPTMFFGREDVFQFIQHALIGQHRDNVIVLYGQRRTGKTSVLYQMRYHLDARYLCIFMDMHGFALEGLRGFLWELANHIIRTLRRDYQLQMVSPNRSEFMADPRSSFENEFLNQVKSIIGDRHILLMLDEVVYLQEQVLAGKLEHEIFEYLRYLMQHYEWLNFLFSLGSGLEEMEKEYAFLFNVGLYKKISFLDRDATRDLITQPIKEYYEVESAAVDRIYHLTSGQPYYTQLLCHCLCNALQRQSMTRIEPSNVDDVLDEAVERGSAVLKYSWEELTPGEKTIVAGMATPMGDHTRAVEMKEIDRAWRRCNLIIPEGEKAKAIRSLIARDIITGQEKYAFTVDLQRLWVQKYRRIEWVKEEAVGFPLEARKPPRLPWRMNPVLVRFLLISICAFLLIGGSGRVLYASYYLPNQQHASATATAQAMSTQTVRNNAVATAQIATASALLATGQNPYPPYQGILLVNAPLAKNTQDHGWDEGVTPDTGFCTFTGGAYHVGISKSYQFWYCSAENLTFSDFAYQVQMTILRGDYGGIFFRNPTGGSLYYFYIDIRGNYSLDLDSNHNYIRTVSSGSSSFIKTGFNQSNLIAVVAHGSDFDLYVNLHHLAHGTDTTFSSGQLGVIADEQNHATEVVFSNAKVWNL